MTDRLAKLKVLEKIRDLSPLKKVRKKLSFENESSHDDKEVIEHQFSVNLLTRGSRRLSLSLNNLENIERIDLVIEKFKIRATKRNVIKLLPPSFRGKFEDLMRFIKAVKQAIESED